MSDWRGYDRRYLFVDIDRATVADESAKAVELHNKVVPYSKEWAAVSLPSSIGSQYDTARQASSRR